MGSCSSGTLVLADQCRALTASSAPEIIEAAACLDKTLVGRFAVSLGSGPVLWALEEAARILPHVEGEFADIPELPRRQIGANLEAWILDIVALLANVDEASFFMKSMPQVARGAARLEVPFERVTRSMRKAQSEYTSRFFHALSRSGLQPEDYQQLVAAISRVTDDGFNQFVVHYLDERAKLLDSQLARRRELIRELIERAGSMSRAEAVEIGDNLGFCIDHFHTGFVVVHRSHSAVTEQRIIRQDLRAKLRNVEMLIQSDGHARTSFWITTPKKPGPAIIETILQTLAEFRGTIRTMGEPAQGVDGFRQTHLQANDLAVIAPHLTLEQILRWTDHALTVTLGANLERARWFVGWVLGPLADPTEKADEQRRTLRAYLSSGQSLIHAAERRNVHRNTIVYRLQQIEQLIRHPIQERALELQCALHLIEQFGDQILNSELLIPPSHN